MNLVLALLVGLAAPDTAASAPPPAPPIPIPAIDRWAPALTHPLFPLSPGATYAYVDSISGEIDTVRVARETREIMGVRATVVVDRVHRGGRLIEDTHDYYAQDRAGNVWYLGEDTREPRAGGAADTAGTWRWGRDGALPGIVMWAQPRPGRPYRQEYLPGHAEDMALVAETGVTVTVPAGRYANCVVIEEWSPLEPGVRERKTYAPRVGLVEERTVAGGRGHMVLVSWTKPAFED